MGMSSIERVARALDRRRVDRTPVALGLWRETPDRWKREGHIREDEDVREHFDQDMHTTGWLNATVDLDFVPEIIEETEDTLLKLDGNGARLREHKGHVSTPEHVGFTVTEREAWLSFAKPRLTEFDRRRIPFEGYREARAFAARHGRFLAYGVVAPFELMHLLCGHENVLMGMALDPDWVRDMVDTYAQLNIDHLEELFAVEGPPDGLLICEDLGFKHKPFMSPAMYEAILAPGHGRLFAFGRSLGCKSMVHSCGYVEPLVPGLVEQGMDCLHPMEVKAGMDMPRLHRSFGQRLAFYGGVDGRLLIDGSLSALDREMDAKILPVVTGGGGYILGCDGTGSPGVAYETMRHFVERGRELGRGRP